MSEPTDFGARLRQARESRGVSLREIATTTKIARGALEALERNEIARLPGGIFTRAFVRSYAAEVGLDPEKTLREFLAAFPVDGVADGSPYATDGREDETFESQRQIAGIWLWLGLLSVPVIGLLLYFGMGGPTPTADVVPAAGRPAAEVGETAPPLAALPAGVEETASETLLISIAPDAPCWVSATVDGEIVLSRLMQPGELERIEARDEVVLNVGDAGAFVFTLNGQAGEPLGAAGQVVTARINRENYRDYLVP